MQIRKVDWVGWDFDVLFCFFCPSVKELIVCMADAAAVAYFLLFVDDADADVVVVVDCGVDDPALMPKALTTEYDTSDGSNLYLNLVFRLAFECSRVLCCGIIIS